MRLQTPLSSSTQNYLPAYCYSTDLVGHVVYSMGNKVGNHYQVTRVNIDDIRTVPPLGLVIQKISATECVVQVAGVVRNVYSGMTPNAALFVAPDGTLTPAPPAPTSVRRAHLFFAQAITDSDLLITPKLPIIRAIT